MARQAQHGVLTSYHRQRVVGEGSYGKVFEAVHLRTGERVALKRVKLDNDVNGLPRSVLREVALLRRLRHANIVRFRTIEPEPRRLYIVLDYVGGDLARLMRLVRPLSPEVIQSVVFQLLRALEYCHAHDVVHRDVKPHNILIQPNGHVQLADFGLSRVLGGERVHTPDQVTLVYRPPEILLGDENHTPAVDGLSACGAVSRRLGAPTEAQWPRLRQLPWYQDYFRPEPTPLDELLPSLSTHAINLLQQMLEYNPENRITTTDALAHPYFARFRTGVAGEYAFEPVPLPVDAEALERV